MEWLKKNWLIVTIAVVAVFFRFYQLGILPPGLHPDEAANGLDIISMIEEGNFQAIYDTNGPREALFFYLQGIFVFIGKALGVTALNFTPLSLRIAPAIIGVLTVIGTYLLGKEFYNKNVGLIAAGTMAVSAWHTQFSRNGFRAIMAPFALVFLFYFFIKAYRSGAIKDYLFTAVFLATGFYTYLSFRMVPLVFGAILIYILVKDRLFLKKNIKKLAIFTLTFILLLVPLFIHFYRVPEDLAGRSSTSIFNEELNGGSPVKTLGDNIIKTVKMFNIRGDENFRHNLGGTPMLDPLVGVLFWIGALVVVLGLLTFENFILIMWGGALSLPEVLTAEGIPHALRIVGIIPIVFILAGIGLDLILKKLNLAKYQTGIIVFVLVMSGYFGFQKYFLDFPTYGETGEAYAEDMVKIANDINKAPQGRKNILIVGEYGTKTVSFITHSSSNEYVRYEAREVGSTINVPSDNYKIFVQKDWHDEAIRQLSLAGYSFDLKEVKSQIDGRVIYYEYEEN